MGGKSDKSKSEEKDEHQTAAEKLAAETAVDPPKPQDQREAKQWNRDH